MIYNPNGVKFEGKEPMVFRSKSEQGHSTQRYVYIARICSKLARDAGGESMMKGTEGLARSASRLWKLADAILCTGVFAAHAGPYFSTMSVR